jgi:hypothetical protein
MDPFEKLYWSKLQVELWVCTRSSEAVSLAEHAPGRTRLADLSIGPDGLDDEACDQHRPTFDDEIEQIGVAIANYGFVCEFDDARKEVIVALSKGQLQEHEDRSSGVRFFESKQVLKLWPVLITPPERSVARGPEAKLPSESRDAADSARAPARIHAREQQRAMIPPAPKRGPAPRYDWPLFQDVLDQLVRDKPDVSQAEAVRAMSDWCAENWGDEGGPGEPADSTIRRHIAYHAGALWAKSNGKVRRKPLSRRTKASARTSM